LWINCRAFGFFNSFYYIITQQNSHLTFLNANEISKYKLDLMGVQEVRWNRGGTEPAGEYIFLYEKGNGNHELGTDRWETAFKYN
jgi:hypothetical protein